MGNIGENIMSIVAAVIGLAIMAIVISNQANTVNVLTAFFGGVSNLIGVAISPVTGQSVGGLQAGGLAGGTWSGGSSSGSSGFSLGSLMGSGGSGGGFNIGGLLGGSGSGGGLNIGSLLGGSGSSGGGFDSTDGFGSLLGGSSGGDGGGFDVASLAGDAAMFA